MSRNPLSHIDCVYVVYLLNTTKSTCQRIFSIQYQISFNGNTTTMTNNIPCSPLIYNFLMAIRVYSIIFGLFILERKRNSSVNEISITYSQNFLYIYLHDDTFPETFDINQNKHADITFPCWYFVIVGFFEI